MTFVGSMQIHKVQMAKEQVEYSMAICIFSDTKCMIMLYILLCDINNNWVMLLFTLCTLLTLYVDLVGGMGTCEANLSQTGRHS